MGVPPVIIHSSWDFPPRIGVITPSHPFLMGFSKINQRFLCYPHDYGTPHIIQRLAWRAPAVAEHHLAVPPHCSFQGATGRQELSRCAEGAKTTRTPFRTAPICRLGKKIEAVTQFVRNWVLVSNISADWKPHNSNWICFDPGNSMAR